MSSDSIEFLRNYREDTVRDPEKIRDLWDQLENIENKLGDDKYTIIEQVCMAAIDLHDHDIINHCLGKLLRKFPGSNRVKILEIQATHELSGDYDQAIKLYDEMLLEDKTNTAAHKRLIAINIERGQTAQAIEALCSYLKYFMNDQEAWKELCDLYLSVREHQRAIFCMEELLLSNPHSHVYHERLAEIHYTVGTLESLDLARSYYTQAVKIAPTNMRALMGLQLTLKRLLDNSKINAQQRRDFEKLNQWIKGQIIELYDSHGHPEIAIIVKDSLKA